MTTETLRERIAELQHQQWSGWMEYLFSKCIQSGIGTGEDVVIPAEFAQRWVRQMQTEYDDLPENEKESDRIEADKYLPLIRQEKIAVVKEFAEMVKLELRVDCSVLSTTLRDEMNKDFNRRIDNLAEKLLTKENEPNN